MPALSLMHSLAAHKGFQTRVHMGCANVAREVFAEDPATDGHWLRESLALVVYNPDLASAGYAPAVAADPAVAAAAEAAYDPANPDAAPNAVTDELVLAAVRRLWNWACGHRPQQQPAQGLSVD
ncbi:hypothetical protein GCM10020367_20790 [Streptomyces sannanensis]|uniref:Uncharacterized protein n=1 Tax=Streptomyces sannanensis TaxID=285536 RepID=A0ABP6S901_9ACTN